MEIMTIILPLVLVKKTFFILIHGFLKSEAFTKDLPASQASPWVLMLYVWETPYPPPKRGNGCFYWVQHIL